MIYCFECADPYQKDFLVILEENSIDHESIDYDRTVIRILGSVPPEVEEKLEEIYALRKRSVSTHLPSDNIHSDFADKSSPTVIAGPCSVESEEQIAAVASLLSDLNVGYVRGGAYKPRTSPKSFQGMGKIGLDLISNHARQHDLKVVSEVMDRSQIDYLLEHADVIQVGSRNMFNYTLLTALGSIDKPVLLKRGMAATIDEWLAASEYVSRGGNDAIILCERGIRTFEPRTRNTLDISAICLAQQLSGYPVIADPSHATGSADLVVPLTMAALSAGADGIMVEMHPRPDQALSDMNQALSFPQFKDLIERIERRHAGQSQPPEE